MLETDGVNAPAKQALVGEPRPPTKVPDTVLLPKSTALPVLFGVIY